MTPPRVRPPRTVAVIGGGVAGLTAAYILSEHAHVTLVDADTRLGGHAHTHQVSMPSGAVVGVDSGFIVHNDRTYPTLLRLFGELGVATQETDMSMSVSSARTGLEYAGALGVSGLFPTARHLTRGGYLKMLGEVTRFHRAARRLLDTPDSDEPLYEFVARERFSDYFTEHFLLPLVAAVWSCDSGTAAQYPARYLFTFLDHHGMLSVFGSPTWRTVTGGSVTYVDAVADVVRRRGGRVRLGTPVRQVRTLDATADEVAECDTAVEVTLDGAVPVRFDAAVVATHPRQALAMLADPSPEQRRVLGSIDYVSKPAVLHSDVSVMPRARRAWASWNYRIPPDGDSSPAGTRPAHPRSDIADLDGSGVVVTYDLTRLMRLDTDHPRMLVTMGRTDLVDQSSVIASMTYEHPVYTTGSVAAQALLPDIEDNGVVFAGAYHGWGFHEDGAASGARAAARLGVDWPMRGTASGRIADPVRPSQVGHR